VREIPSLYSSDFAKSSAPAARDVYSIRQHFHPSSEGTKYKMSLLRSWGAITTRCYKYLAPPELDLGFPEFARLQLDKPSKGDRNAKKTDDSVADVAQ
jgi:hypothetical protein